MRKFGAIALGWRKPLTVQRVNLQWTRSTDDILPIGVVKSKGDLMAIDTYAKSVQILERIANSIHERDPTITINLINNHSLCFSKKEVGVVEQWLEEIYKEITEDCVCLDSGT